MFAPKFFYVSLGILALAFGAATTAAAIVIDFEGLPSMPVVAGAPIPDPAKLSDQFLASDGVSFSSGAPYVAVVELGPNHATSGVNGIAGSTPDGRLWYEPIYPVRARFFFPADPSQLAVTDYISLRGDLEGDSGGTVTLNAYDPSGNLVGSVKVPDSGGQLLATRPRTFTAWSSRDEQQLRGLGGRLHVQSGRAGRERRRADDVGPGEVDLPLTRHVARPPTHRLVVGLGIANPPHHQEVPRARS
jgi:hypothetical protein